MTQDEILMELRQIIATTNHFTTWTVSTPHLVALVKLAIDREREACAEMVDSYVGFDSELSESIRARGQA
jgi:hypothetical protein